MRFAPVSSSHTVHYHNDLPIGLEEATIESFKIMFIDSMNGFFGPRYVVYGMR